MTPEVPAEPPPGHVLVVEARVVSGALPGLSEPVTIATLRDARGVERALWIVGGPNPEGGVTRLAGYVVPIKGAVVREDLREERGLSDLHAWTTNSPAGTWAPSALPVSYALALPLSRDLGQDALAELDVALRTWPEVACTGWRTSFAGSTNNSAGDDGVNGVYWHDDTWPAALIPLAIGQTISHTDATGALHDTDLHLNGADYRFSLDGAANTIDARSILTHELGHALGLGHSTVPGATMDPAYPGGIAWRSLEQDDRAGVCALYPGTGTPGCEAAACPNPVVCVAEVCERRGAQGEVCSPCERVPGACAGAGDTARCIDIGSGGNAGRVCGRACATDTDCGGNFHCQPTTTSGDLQCVPTDACASGPDPCSSDADCVPNVCRSGACVGPAETSADAGAADATIEAPAPSPAARGGGCSEASGQSNLEPLLGLGMLTVARGSRRMRCRRAAKPPRE